MAFVKRIIELNADGAQRVYGRKKKKKRKVSKWMKPMERASRRSLEANQRFFDTLLSRQNRSNRKRRDGWIRDMPLNMARAQRKGLKKLLKF